MNYRFNDARFQRFAGDSKRVERAHGGTVARNLYRRLAVIMQAADSRDLFAAAGRLHPLAGDRTGDFAFNLSGNQRLIIRFEDERRTAVIVGIEDYH